jgi:hypothetical protein
MTFIIRLILAPYLSALLLLWSVLSISCHLCALFEISSMRVGAWFWNFLFVIQEQEGFQISSMRVRFWSLVGRKWLEGPRLWVRPLYSHSHSGERDDRVSCLWYTGLCLVSSINTGSKDPTCYIYTCLILISIPGIYMTHTSPKLVLEPMIWQKLSWYESFKSNPISAHGWVLKILRIFNIITKLVCSKLDTRPTPVVTNHG